MLSALKTRHVAQAAEPDAMQTYADCINRGYTRIQDRRVVLCGLARNCEDVLPLTIQRLTRIGEMYGDYRVVIYENDSVDKTRSQLLHWSESNPRVSLLLEERGDPINPHTRCAHRADRMAHYRNRYREYVAEQHSQFDHAIVADMDLPGGWDYDGIAHTFGCDDWDFVGSYGIISKRYLLRERQNQYDAWAYRSLGDDSPLTTKYVNRLSSKIGDPLIPVNSCFGGLGVYRLEALLRAAYQGGDCEHVGLHREMREQGLSRLFLNPNQRAFYGTKLSTWRRRFELARHFAHLVRRSRLFKKRATVPVAING